MTLNAAFLVDDNDAPSFRSAVDEITARGPEGSVLVAGPWPPYSFATLEQP
jgi:hypothetical protein